MTKPPSTPGNNDGQADEGISPVVGAILMVAITVVLAAVILFFLTGLSNPTAPATAGFAISEESDGVHVTLLSVGTGDSFEMRVNGAVLHTWNRSDVGSEVVLTGVGPGDEVTFVGTNEEKDTVVRNHVVDTPTPGATPVVTTNTASVPGPSPVSFSVATTSEWSNGTFSTNTMASSLTFAETDTNSGTVAINPRVIDVTPLENGPTGASFGVLGGGDNIVVTDSRIYTIENKNYDNNILTVHDRSGTEIYSYDPPGDGIEDFEVDTSTGEVYLGSFDSDNTDRITKLDNSGNQIWTQTYSTDIDNYIELSPTGDLYLFLDEGSYWYQDRGYQRIDTNDGGVMYTVEVGERIDDMGFDDSGNVYISFRDYPDAHVEKYSPAGNRLWTERYDDVSPDVNIAPLDTGEVVVGLPTSPTVDDIYVIDGSNGDTLSTSTATNARWADYSEEVFVRVGFSGETSYWVENVPDYSDRWSISLSTTVSDVYIDDSTGYHYVHTGNSSLVTVAETVDGQYTSERFDAGDPVSWQNVTLDVSQFDSSVSHATVEFRFSNDTSDMTQAVVTHELTGTGETTIDLSSDPAFAGTDQYQYVEFEVTMWTVDDTNVVIESVVVNGQAA